MGPIDELNQEVAELRQRLEQDREPRTGPLRRPGLLQVLVPALILAALFGALLALTLTRG